MPLVKLDQLPELEISRGIMMRAVTAQTVTVGHVKIAKGSPLPEHSHYHEQVVNVVEGELEMVIEGETHSLVQGKVLVIPPNVVHSGRAITDCRVVDVFHPVREDFRGTSFGGYSSRDKS